MGVSKYKYKYNGKEWNDDLGYNMNEMDYRQYNPAIGRWMNVDPLAETTMQPYSAFNNNPIYYNDPTGMIAESVVSPPFDGIDQYWDDDGLFFWDRENKTYQHFIIDSQGQTLGNGTYDTPGGLDQISGEFGIIHNGQGVGIDTSAPNLTVNKDGSFSYGGSTKGIAASAHGSGWGWWGKWTPAGKKAIGADVAVLNTEVSFSVSGNFLSDELSVSFVKALDQKI